MKASPEHQRVRPLIEAVKASELVLRVCIREIITEKTLRGKGKKKRLLYHIAASGGIPRPIPKMKWIVEWDAQAVDRHTGEKTGEDVRIAPDNSWKRHWLDQPVESGIFLSPNWQAISSFHGRIGHVYAFKVPEWVIKKAGGVHRYDHGSEVLISEEIWNEAGDEIEFLGKSVDDDEVLKHYEHSMSDTFTTVNRMGTPRSPSWMDAEELEAWKAKQKEFNLRGLRATKHPADVIKLLKPDEVKAALVAFEKAYPEALTGKKHKTEWDKQPGERQGFPSLARVAELPISTKDQELIDLLKKRMSESVVKKYVSLLLTEARTRQPGDLSQEDLLALTEYVLTGNGVYDFTEKFAGSHAELTQAPDTGEFTSRSKQARAQGRPARPAQGVAKKIADQMTSLPTPERSRRFTFELIDVVNRPDYINYLVGDKPVAVEYSGMLTKEETSSLNSAQEHITFISRDDIRHTNFNISEADTLVIENIREKLSAGRVSRPELRHAGLKIADVLARSVPASVLGGPIEGFMVQQGSRSYKVVNPEYARVQRLQAPLYAAFGGRSNMSKRVIRSRLMKPTEGDRMIQDIKRYLESVPEMPEGFRTFFSSEDAAEISTALDSAISGDTDAGDRVYRRINQRVNDRDSWVNT